MTYPALGLPRIGGACRRSRLCLPRADMKDHFMTKPSQTQSQILNAAAQRPGLVALPLPKGLHGAAAGKVVSVMLARRLLDEVDANIRNGEPLWRETGDGHGTTLVATEAGLLAIGTETVVARTMIAIQKHAAGKPDVKLPSPRAGTKQAKLIALLETPDGATVEEIVNAIGWQSHTVRGAVSGVLKKKLGLKVTSEKIEGRGRVYRLPAA